MPNGALAQPPWMPHAWADLGQREIAGPASNPRIADYIRRSGHPAAADDATAWCAAFVGACLDRAGLTGTGSLLARSYLDWGRPADPPMPGAIAVLSRGVDPTFGHVGFVVGMTGDRVVLLGGNQSDAVTVETFALSRVLAFRLPASPGEASPPDATPSDSAAAPDASAFHRSLIHILAFEGGWTDDPFDPGGPTNKGITLAVFARAQGEEVTAESHSRLKAGLRRIPDALVHRIYLDRYWRPACCERLPAPLAHFHFDTAVNQGVAGAARMLQEALGVDIDGEIGPLTLAAAARGPVPSVLERYASIRRRRYRDLQHFWRFGRGWLARVDQALAQSLAIAGEPAPPDRRTAVSMPVPLDPEPEETAPMPAPDQTNHHPAGAAASDGKWWGNSLTVWGALLTAATTVAPAVFAALGLDVPADLVRRLGADAVAVVQAVGGLVGTVMTIAGRARASTRLERRALAVRL